MKVMITLQMNWTLTSCQKLGVTGISCNLWTLRQFVSHTIHCNYNYTISNYDVNVGERVRPKTPISSRHQ